MKLLIVAVIPAEAGIYEKWKLILSQQLNDR